MYLQKLFKLNISSVAALVTIGTLHIGVGLASPEGESFSTPEQAARALVRAAERHDVAGALKILGPSAKELLTTSDPVADRRMRATFVKRAKEKMVVISDPDRPKQKLLELGNDRWPFPIPIVRSAGQWRFDVSQGKQQILLRRIGNGELTAIDVCRGYVEAQNEYFDRDWTGRGGRQYAQKVVSSTGQRDGLYWPSTDANDESPISEFVAKAIAEGYTKRGQPYQGYYFKILKGQGPHASGGAMSYLEDGAMTRGFALIAWPSDYRSTGVMTFLVDRAGIVYQKDLGAKTAEIATSTSVYDPDQTWTPVSGSGVPPNKRITRTTSR
jgi:hypothetical protein